MIGNFYIAHKKLPHKTLRVHSAYYGRANKAYYRRANKAYYGRANKVYYGRANKVCYGRANGGGGRGRSRAAMGAILMFH